MTGPEELAVRQARGVADAARELAATSSMSLTEARDLIDHFFRQPCSWGDDAWHRAVTRLVRIHRPEYRRLLAEERVKTGGEQP